MRIIRCITGSKYGLSQYYKEKPTVRTIVDNSVQNRCRILTSDFWYELTSYLTLEKQLKCRIP